MYLLSTNSNTMPVRIRRRCARNIRSSDSHKSMNSAAIWSNSTTFREKTSRDAAEGRHYFPPFSFGVLNQFDFLLSTTRGIRDAFTSENNCSHYKQVKSPAANNFLQSGCSDGVDDGRTAEVCMHSDFRRN